MRTLCSLPGARANQYFAVALALATMKLVNRHVQQNNESCEKLNLFMAPPSFSLFGHSKRSRTGAIHVFGAPPLCQKSELRPCWTPRPFLVCLQPEPGSICRYAQRKFDIDERALMNAGELLWRTEWFSVAAADLIVLGITIASYRRRPRRSVMLIALGAASAFICIVVRCIAGTTSPMFWGLMSLVSISADVFWVAGVYLLLAELTRLDGTCPGPGAPPTGGPSDVS
jgi:hypothetical protein